MLQWPSHNPHQHNNNVPNFYIYHSTHSQVIQYFHLDHIMLCSGSLAFCVSAGVIWLQNSSEAYVSNASCTFKMSVRVNVDVLVGAAEVDGRFHRDHEPSPVGHLVWSPAAWSSNRCRAFRACQVLSPDFEILLLNNLSRLSRPSISSIYVGHMLSCLSLAWSSSSHSSCI